MESNTQALNIQGAKLQKFVKDMSLVCYKLDLVITSQVNQIGGALSQ
jgi:hypothetical protein